MSCNNRARYARALCKAECKMRNQTIKGVNHKHDDNEETYSDRLYCNDLKELELFLR